MDYSTLASNESLEKTISSLKNNGFMAEAVDSGEAALARLKELIPAGASVNNGSSVTLTEIGLIEYLKNGDHGWNNLHNAILAESDLIKQSLLRRQSTVSDYYLGSVHALSETGELVIASNTGSQLPHLAYTSPNIILIVGAQKIVPDLKEALRRVEEYVVPLEDTRLLGEYGIHTTYAKTLILHKENSGQKRVVRVIIVKQKLGF